MQGFLKSKTTYAALAAVMSAVIMAVQTGEFRWQHLLIIAISTLAATLRDALKTQTNSLVDATWRAAAGPGADPSPPTEGDGRDV